jgi:hypothetical protein
MSISGCYLTLARLYRYAASLRRAEVIQNHSTHMCPLVHRSKLLSGEQFFSMFDFCNVVGMQMLVSPRVPWAADYELIDDSILQAMVEVILSGSLSIKFPRLSMAATTLHV